MRKSLKFSRGAQIVGAAFFVFGIVSCSEKSNTSTMAQAFLVGLVLIIGARVYEWMTKE